MPVSSYWADVEVEVAFDSGFSTPAVDRTWTDVSDYVDSDQAISINFGRTDERSQADANTLSLTLSNGDGRFTPGRSGSPYYPDVRLYRPIRVTATPPGGAASVRFTGYVTAWNPGWPDGTDAWSTVQVSASSRLQRLGLADQRRSVIEETYALDGPAAYYTLGDPEASTVATESSGNGLPSATATGAGAAVVFGSATGPPTDGLTAAQFAGGQTLAATISPVTGGSGVSVECFFLTSTAANQGIVRFGQVGLINTGTLAAVAYNPDDTIAATVPSPGSVVDGLTHHAAATWDGSTLILYLDGVSVGSTAAAPTPAAPTVVEMGRSGPGGVPLPFTGVIAHMAGYASVLGASRVAEHALAGTSGFGNESTADRFERLASWARIPSAEVASSGTSRTALATDPTGASVVDLMRALEVTEQGAMFDATDGTLTLLGPEDRYTATPAFTLDFEDQYVGNDYAPVYEPSDIVNDATVTQASEGGAVARVLDTASRDDYGVATSSTDIVSDNADDAAQLAAWQVFKYAEPRTRIPNVTVNVPDFVGGTPDCDDILAATIGTLITLENRPNQDETSSADLFIEGYTEVIGGVGVHTISFNVSAATPDQDVWVLQDPVRGEIDATYVLSY